MFDNTSRFNMNLLLSLIGIVAALLIQTNEFAEASVVRNLIKRATDKYTTKYDGIDIDRILSSQRLVRNYINCLLEKGPCTTEGVELKKYLPDALATECSKCSEVQKREGGKILSFILQNYREYWNQLVEKYDKDGNFRTKYELDDEDYEDEN